MKVEAESELIGFQTWLNHCLRHGWILAFAVAIPGAFLLTVWSPYSPEAFVGMAVFGIGIGIISDLVRYVRKYVAVERFRTALALSKAIQKTASLIDRRITARALPSEEAEALRLWLVELGRPRSYAMTSMHLVMERLNAIHNLQVSIADKLATEGDELPGALVHDAPIVESFASPEGHRELLLARESAVARHRFGIREVPLPDAKLYGELLVKLHRMAAEMHVPMEYLCGYLNWMTSRKDLLLEALKELKSSPTE